MGRLFSILKSVQLSLHSGHGYWMQKVSEAIDAIAPDGQAIAAAAKPFVQTQLSTAGAGQALGNNTTVLFDAPGFGDLPYNPATGVFTLAPDKSYLLSAHFALSTFSGETVNFYIEWVDAITNVKLVDGHGAFLTP